MSGSFSAFGGINDGVYETARTSVSEMLARAAALKNVPLSPEELDEAARVLLTAMDWAEIHNFTGLDGLAARNWAVNGHLDMIAVARLKGIIRDIEGRDDINDPAVTAVALEIVTKLDAALASRECVHWPNVGALVMNHYAGKPHGPTVGVGEDGTVCTRWWLGFDFHRDPKEGPANIEEKGALRVEEYWVQGQLDRLPADGPAVIVTDDGNDGKGARRIEEYWVEGRLHRPHEEGPAMIYTHYKNLDLSGEEYFENGKWHRPAELGPAVRQRDRVGRVVLEHYCENGELHRDPKHGPAWFEIRDATTMEGTPDNTTLVQYCVHGQGHRDEQDGPAVMVQDNNTGVILSEQYWRHGFVHRGHGPAEIERNADGSLFREAWMRDGELHRPADEGPAVIIRQGNGITFEEWWVKGKRHRDPKDGPAFIRHDLVKGTVHCEFWVEGNYRAAADGPAPVTHNRNGKAVEELHWDGERMSPHAPEKIRAEATVHG